MSDFNQAVAYWPLALKVALLVGGGVYLIFALMIFRHVAVLGDVLTTPKTIWFRRVALGHLLASILLIFLILGLL